MHKIFLGLTAVLMLSGCASSNSRYANDESRWRDYDYDRPDPSYNGYDAARYYRDGQSYSEQQMAEEDRLYRGQDGRYYCRRSDGTTGLIVGGVAGGLLGNAIAPGGSKTLGTVIGAGAGALAGQAIDRSSVHCR